MAETIPGPRSLPIVGNLLDIWEDRSVPLRALERLAGIYGPICQVSLAGRRRIICSSAELFEELTNEKRFAKMPPPTVSAAPGPKGLFAAANEDPDWAQGHRILMPSFAPLSVQDMLPDMKDIASQLILSWARKGPENRILVTEDFTRLTLDTIALCTMSYRFNSFYQDKMHPFVDAMNFIFQQNTAKSSRPALLQKLMFKANAQVEEARKVLQSTGRGIIEDRRANPTDKHDVLNTMIYGKDPKTGQVMRDDLIVAQMITFLIAGHETTSGMLSFATMYLLKNPHTYLKAQAEVDAVLDGRAVEAADLNKFKYLNAVLRETARLSPTVPVLQKEVNPALAGEIVTVDNGRYKIEPDDHIIVLIGKAQRDPKVWGDTADEFDPDRMLDENFDKVAAQYPASWKPFGNGKRACIGRPFAWQEALLVLAMVLQNFDLSLDDPNYVPTIKQNLTIKPDELYIRATPRKSRDAGAIDRMIHSNGNGVPNGAHATDAPPKEMADLSVGTKKPLTILYGSNTGTCQAFAQRLASDATSRGFHAEVRDMDSATNALPKTHPVIIITASYEGQPPDNAARYMEWLQGCNANDLKDVSYTVFGCGHKDWSTTFHRIPKLANELMEKFGGQRIAPAGFADAAKGNLYGEFEDWLDASLWPSLCSKSNDEAADTSVNIEISTNARASNLRYDVNLATVKENKVLTKGNEPIKCHMDIELPSDMTYQCGDYLAILPLNSEKGVRSIMTHFGLPLDAVVTIKSTGPSTIPGNTPLSVFEVLRSYVELAQPATKKNLRTLARYTEDANDKTYLEGLAEGDARYEDEVIGKRVSILDLLAHRPSIKLPFEVFLGLLPPLHVRQYSISSSPLEDPNRCSITYGVIDTAALSDPAQRFEGVSGHYLQSLKPGDTIQVSVRPTAKKTFRLPVDIEQTPLLMFAAGTGLAPFRGFLQERALQLQANPDRKLAPALLFLGCRSQTADRIYAEQLDSWIESGVVDIRYSFSKEKDASQGCAHVPERMVHDAEDIVTLWRKGGRAYVCGTRRFAEGIRGAASSITEMVREREGKTTEEDKKELARLFQAAVEARVASDVFD